MTQEEKWYEANQMVMEPPLECEFKPGETVKFTNEYGIEFGPYKVLGYTKPENMIGDRYIHINTDSPWFPVHPRSLSRYKLIKHPKLWVKPWVKHKNPWKVLGIKPGSSKKYVEIAYKKLSLKYHPDNEGGDIDIFKHITKAYEQVIKNEPSTKAQQYAVSIIHNSIIKYVSKPLGRIPSVLAADEIQAKLAEVNELIKNTNEAIKNLKKSIAEYKKRNKKQAIAGFVIVSLKKEIRKCKDGLLQQQKDLKVILQTKKIIDQMEWTREVVSVFATSASSERANSNGRIYRDPDQSFWRPY